MCTPGEFSVDLSTRGVGYGFEGDTNLIGGDHTAGEKIVGNSGDKNVGVRAQTA